MVEQQLISLERGETQMMSPDEEWKRIERLAQQKTAESMKKLKEDAYMDVSFWNHDIAVDPEGVRVRFADLCDCGAPIEIEGVPATISLCLGPAYTGDPSETGEVTSLHHELDTMDAVTGCCLECGREISLSVTAREAY